MNDDKGWTMLAGDDEGATVPPANHYCRQGPLGMAVLDADAMIDRYIAARTPKGTLPLHAELRTENEHLRLALLTMAARERETAAERDALRTMLAEARERSGPDDGRLSRLTALMLRVAARRDQLTGDLSVVTGQRDRLRAIVEGSFMPPTPQEIEAHAATGGRWRARLTHGGVYTARYPDAAILAHDGATWWAIDRDDNLCARPATGGA